MLSFSPHPGQPAPTQERPQTGGPAVSWPWTLMRLP